MARGFMRGSSAAKLGSLMHLVDSSELLQEFTITVIKADDLPKL